MIAEGVNIDKDTAWKMLCVDLNVTKFVARYFPGVLTPHPNENHKMW